MHIHTQVFLQTQATLYSVAGTQNGGSVGDMCIMNDTECVALEVSD